MQAACLFWSDLDFKLSAVVNQPPDICLDHAPTIDGILRRDSQRAFMLGNAVGIEMGKCRASPRDMKILHHPAEFFLPADWARRKARTETNLDARGQPSHREFGQNLVALFCPARQQSFEATLRARKQR
jgi:hypothetical protein